MKKVTLIGDSIRQIGYGKRVEELLGSDYEVFQTEDNQYQTNEDIERFNAYIVPRLKAKGIKINDLYSTLYPVKEEILRDDDLNRLNDKGIEICAAQVVDSIKSVIG